MNDQKNGKTIRNGSVVIFAISLVTGIAALGAIHAQFIVPSMLYEAREVMMVELDRHRLTRHPDMVSKEEFKIILDSLTRLEQRLEKKKE